MQLINFCGSGILGVAEFKSAASLLINFCGSSILGPREEIKREGCLETGAVGVMRVVIPFQSHQYNYGIYGMLLWPFVRRLTLRDDYSARSDASSSG